MPYSHQMEECFWNHSLYRKEYNSCGKEKLLVCWYAECEPDLYWLVFPPSRHGVMLRTNCVHLAILNFCITILASLQILWRVLIFPQCITNWRVCFALLSRPMAFFRQQDGSAPAAGGRRRVQEQAGGGGGWPRQTPLFSLKTNRFIYTHGVQSR